MKITVIIGSNRKESYNRKLALFMQERYKNLASFDIVPIELLPMYNQDEELNPPAIVKEIKKVVMASDAVLIVTPEYNHSIPGMLKNALDWFSREGKAMANKPVTIAGCSAG